MPHYCWVGLKSRLFAWSPLTLLMEVLLLVSGDESLAHHLDFSGREIEISHHRLTGGSLCSSLSLWYHGWGWCPIFSVVFGWKWQLLSKSFLLLGCPFLGPLARESRLLLGYFCLHLLILPGCRLLQL